MIKNWKYPLGGAADFSAVTDVIPAIDDTYWLGDDTHGWKGLKFPDLKLYQLDASTLSLENIAGGTYKDLKLGDIKILTASGTLTPSVVANSQTINSVPTAATLTAVNTKTFTGTVQHLVLPAITPAANGGGITMTGLGKLFGY